MQERATHWSISGLRAGIGRASPKAPSARRRDGYEGRGWHSVPPQALGSCARSAICTWDPRLGAAAWGCWGGGRCRRPGWGVGRVRDAVGSGRRGCRGFAALEAAAQAVPARAARPPVPCGLLGSVRPGGPRGLTSPTWKGTKAFWGRGRFVPSPPFYRRNGGCGSRLGSERRGGRPGLEKPSAARRGGGGARGHAYSQPRRWWASASGVLTVPRGLAPGVACLPCARAGAQTPRG